MARPQALSPGAFAHGALTLALLFSCAVSLRSIVLALGGREEFEPAVGRWFMLLVVLAGLSVVLGVGATVVHLRARRRGAPPPFRSLRAALNLCVLATLLYLIFGQPFQRQQFELWAGVACGSLPLWTLLEAQIARRTPPKLLRAIDVLLFNACLLLLTAEVGLRTCTWLWPSAFFTRTSQGAVEFMEQARRPEGEIHLGFPHNSGGHYDEEFRPRWDATGATGAAGRERIVVSIGDSFSLSLVPHHYHYTTVCERLLPGTRVHNMGAAAVGPPEYLLMLCEEALPLEPDLIVIGLFLGNDVGFAGYRSDPRDGFLRSWFDREAVFLFVLPQRIARLRQARRAIGLSDRAIGGVGGEAAASQRRIDDLDALEALLPWLHRPDLQGPGFSHRRYWDIELGRAVSICAEGEEEFAPLFRELEKIVRAAGSTPLAFLLIPDEFQVDDKVWAEVVARLPECELERDRAQRLVTAWLDARKVHYLDLLPRMRALETSTGGAHLYLPLNTHWSVGGNQVGGEALAELVRSMLDEER